MKKVENILAKGEVARFEQFLLLSQCFQKSSAAEASERVFMWERVKPHENQASEVWKHMAIEPVLAKRY